MDDVRYKCCHHYRNDLGGGVADKSDHGYNTLEVIRDQEAGVR